MRAVLLLCALYLTAAKFVRKVDTSADTLEEINRLQALYWDEGDEIHLNRIFRLVDANADSVVTRAEIRTALLGSPSREQVAKAAPLLEQFLLHPEDKTFDAVDFVWTAGMASLM